jgi:hypothetical protein
MTKIAKVIGVDLLKAKAADGRGILKAAEYLAPYVKKSSKAFPYKQIKDWDEVQDKLSLQLYRIDQLLDKPIYKKYYKGSVVNDKDNFYSFVY